jgi:hypothetical protein
MTIQFGLPVWFKKEALEQWRRPEGPRRTRVQHEQMKVKLNTVRDRRYLEPGEVVSLASFFAVSKGAAKNEQRISGWPFTMAQDLDYVIIFDFPGFCCMFL